jgi:hypothetical protein
VQRAEWAKSALAVFTDETFGGNHPDTMTPGDLQDAITDLICDLMHLAHFHPRLASTIIHARALEHFQWEVSREELCDCADRSWYGDYHDTQCPVTMRAGKFNTANAAMLAALRFALPFMEDLAGSGDNKAERRAARLMRKAIAQAERDSA